MSGVSSSSTSPSPSSSVNWATMGAWYTETSSGKSAYAYAGIATPEVGSTIAWVIDHSTVGRNGAPAVLGAYSQLGSVATVPAPGAWVWQNAAVPTSPVCSGGGSVSPVCSGGGSVSSVVVSESPSPV